MFAIPANAPPGQLTGLAGILLLERTFDAPIVRQVQLPPAMVVECAPRVGDDIVETSVGPGWFSCFIVNSQFLTCAGDPVFNLFVTQLIPGARGVVFLEAPVGIERQAFSNH